MKNGQLISIYGAIYEYGQYNKENDSHIVWEIDIDDNGHLTPVFYGKYVTTEELKNNKVDFTQKQWEGIVEHFVRQDYSFSDDDINTIVEDIVCRCFTYGIPTIEELPQYIAEYLDR